MTPWIAVDLDGTLARDDEYEDWNPRRIGSPIPKMVDRVKQWLANGTEVRIFTARVFGHRDGIPPEESRALIEAWCLEHIGQVLPVTCEKDFGMLQLWDDRAIQILKNTGMTVLESVFESDKDKSGPLHKL